MKYRYSIVVTLLLCFSLTCMAMTSENKEAKRKNIQQARVELQAELKKIQQERAEIAAELKNIQQEQVEIEARLRRFEIVREQTKQMMVAMATGTTVYTPRTWAIARRKLSENLELLKEKEAKL